MQWLPGRLIKIRFYEYHFSNHSIIDTYSICNSHKILRCTKNNEWKRQASLFKVHEYEHRCDVDGFHWHLLWHTPSRLEQSWIIYYFNLLRWLFPLARFDVVQCHDYHTALGTRARSHLDNIIGEMTNKKKMT